ncbi:MAG: DUF499 domain-containing protein, partial [Firmicutes bacterium]|nr:DUF499 domain-containing protein [Bacillota bacterium]
QEARFAAHLGHVVRGTADRVYADPETFFTRTHATDGLRSLLRTAMGRLWGFQADAPPVVRLETGFGGGKTHALIALYHAASGKVPPGLLAPYLGQGTPGRALAEPVRVAVIVGDDLNPVAGASHPDGTTTWTLWGEIAYQLGGPAAYELVRANDEGWTPGGLPWREILGDGPVLILLDELAPYLRNLKTSPGHEKRAGLLAPFLKGLLEAVAASPRAVCVLTLAQPSDAFGAETEELGEMLTELLDELKAIAGRLEHLLTPTSGETEIASILVRQLFSEVDSRAARETAEAYYACFETAQRQGADLPPVALSPDYMRFLQSSYPFHPELLVTLNRKVSTIPNFQRTRGVLRLLALTIRRLWETRPADLWLIHPHHLDLGFEPIVEELTSRLGRPRYREVAQADIISRVPERPGFATEIDQEWVASGRPPLARRVATTIFLHSLVREGAVGARPEEVTLDCLAPGEDPTLVNKALEALERRSWYLEYDGEQWRFQTEPSLNKMIVDEMQFVGVGKGKEVLRERLEQIWKPGIFDVRRFPAEPADIPDDAGKPKLAIIHFDAACAREADEGTPDLVRRLFQEKGTQGEPRTFQNNVVFLVSDERGRDEMVERAREAEAVRRLAANAERQRLLSEQQRQRLRERKEESELNLRAAIHRAYRFLYYPSAGATKETAYLAREVLPAQSQGELEKDQGTVILEALRRLEKVYTAGDNAIAPELIKANAWTHGARRMAVADIVRAFATRRGLRMLLDPKPLREGLALGVTRGLWVYYDPSEKRAYGPDSPAPFVRLDGEAELYEPGYAREIGLLAPPGVPEGPGGVPGPVCPVCGMPVDKCRCQAPPPPPERPHLIASGAVEQAIQGILDQMHDRRVSALAWLEISVEGEGAQSVRELRSLGLAVPQLGPGRFSLRVASSASFEPAGTLNLDFSGAWERWRELKDALVSTLDKASAVTIQATLSRLGPDPVTVETLGQFRDVLRHLDLGRVTVKAKPADEKAGAAPRGRTGPTGSSSPSRVPAGR